MTDYATDQMGEWSSQSSEGEGEEGEEEEAGEIDEEEEAEEEEEEVGAGQEPPVSMRLRSRTSAVSSQVGQLNSLRCSLWWGNYWSLNWWEITGH